MGARWLASRVTVVLGGLASVALLVSGSASAALTHEYLSSFGAFSSVDGVAVGQSSGDVYVYDAGAGSVLKFDAEGAPVSFSSTGTNAIAGVGGAGEGEGQIAVDNSAGPAKGDIYVANGTKLEIYGADGKSLGELSQQAGKPWGKPCGVAVDTVGHVYIGLYPPEEGSSSSINQYAPSANPATNADYASSLWKVNNVCNLAVDAAGSVYTDTFSEGPLTEFEALQFSPVELAETVGTPVAESGRALAVDNATNDLYVAQYNQVAQYESSGLLLDLFTGFEANAFGNAHGLAVNGENGQVYVSDNNRARISIFGPTVTIPDVTTGQASNLSTTNATLHGTVNPDKLSVTSCRFEYGATPSLGQTAPCAPEPGSGGNPIEVTASVGGLQANATYYYRLAAANENGTNRGQTLEVLTYSPPILTSEWSSAVSLTTATLNARLRSMGFSTTYRFEYGTSTAYGKGAPAGGGGIGVEEGALVSQPISGLQEGVTYHYRLTATNAQGTIDGPDQAFTTSATPVGGVADTCPNAAYRIDGPSEALPDCRAYEMVSPLDKNGSNVGGNGHFSVHASIEGERASFRAGAGFADTVGSGANGLTDYVASRGTTGWTTHSLTPPSAPNAFAVTAAATYVQGYAADLEHSLWYGYQTPSDDPGTGGQNLYRSTTQSRKLETITIPSGSEPLPEYFELEESAVGFSSDVGVVAFANPRNLLPETTGSLSKLYEWEYGTLRLAGILPDGEVPAGGSGAPGPGRGLVANEGSVSSDGSRVLFVSPVDGSAPQQLYMRRNGRETVWVSRPETSTPGIEPQGVKFQKASQDGRRVVLSSETPLLASDPGGSGMGVYLYTDSANPEAESNLKFLFRDSGVSVFGMSEDISRIYYYAEPGTTPSGMYLWDKGTVHLVAKMGPFNGNDSTAMRVSSDGRRMAFLWAPGIKEEPELAKPATGGDVGETAPGQGHQAMYLYDEDSETVTCVSCPHSGAAMGADVEIAPVLPTGSIIGGTEFRQRYLSSDGRRVFFSTPDALVPQDTNGLPDVYEYDADAHEVKLLSSGTGEGSAWFEDASASGDNVLFITSQKLVDRDTDTLIDLYDARVDGGFAEPLPPPASCEGDACQGVPSAVPSFSTASGFAGLGNQASQPVVKATAKKKPTKHARKKVKKKKVKRHKGQRATGGKSRSAVRISGRTGR